MGRTKQTSKAYMTTGDAPTDKTAARIKAESIGGDDELGYFIALCDVLGEPVSDKARDLFGEAPETTINDSGAALVGCSDLLLSFVATSSDRFFGLDIKGSKITVHVLVGSQGEIDDVDINIICRAAGGSPSKQLSLLYRITLNEEAWYDPRGAASFVGEEPLGAEGAEHCAATFSISVEEAGAVIEEASRVAAKRPRTTVARRGTAGRTTTC